MGRIVNKILSAINRAYGKPRPLERSDPVDELIRTILSQNTNDRNSLSAFSSLKKYFKSWGSVASAGVNAIASVIRTGGLSNIKAMRIKYVLNEIRRREGMISLDFIGRMDTAEAVGYLRSIKGVGPKTAACVLLFSFGKPVMPVDTHIFRVTKRLGLIDAECDIEAAHAALSRLVPVMSNKLCKFF